MFDSVAFPDSYSPVEVLVREGHKASRCQGLLHRVGVMTHCVLVPSIDEGDINPKVLQLISDEKIQVRKCRSSNRIPIETETGVCFLHGVCLEALRMQGRVWVGQALSCDAMVIN